MPINNRRVQKIQPQNVRPQIKTVARVQPKTVNRPQQNTVVQNPLSDRFKAGPTSVDKIWNDEVVYIVGGGSSLKDFDWTRLNGKKVIAINRAFEVLPAADVLYWTDTRFYRWFKDGIDKFKGLKVTCRPLNDNPGDITVLKPNSSVGLDMRPEYISSGNNSGYGALTLAVKLGAKRIYLLGYDMVSKGDKTHWHNGYQVTHNHTIYSKMLSQFNSLPEHLNRLGIEVFNANPDSKMDAFRRVSLDSAINNNPIIPQR